MSKTKNELIAKMQHDCVNQQGEYQDGVRYGALRMYDHRQKEIDGLREQVKELCRAAWSAATDREPGMLLHNPDSRYGASDPEMRGCDYIAGPATWKSFDQWYNAAASRVKEK